jgi:superfamily II DNA helicase RecQ
MVKEAIAIIKLAVESVYTTSDRLIVFCMIKQHVSNVVSELRKLDMGVVEYGGTNSEKQIQLKSWKGLGGCIIVGTSAIGVGIDCSSVLNTVHLGGGYGILDLVQEMGRGGRDGRVCTSYVITDTKYLSKIGSESPKIHQLIEWIDQDKECRLVGISKLIDGVILRCSDHGVKNVYCDICEKVKTSMAVKLSFLTSKVCHFLKSVYIRVNKWMFQTKVSV